jgi:hypothetical protein
VRDLLYSFSGVIAYPQLPKEHIRGGRLHELSGQGSDFFVGEAASARKLYGRMGGDKEMILRSIFTICPAGFGRWTFRFMQSLFYGSIPVLISDGYRLPFESEIPWNEIIVRIPEKELENIPAILRGISEKEIAMRQNALLKNRKFFTEKGVLELMISKLEQVLKTNKNQQINYRYLQG